ncbi:hypothetical protein JXA80_01560, partial [bacterium]|nr:hypothetical protein [candidate division CSSED10-310 bacterium]
MTRLNRRIPAATAVLAVLVLLCFQPQIDSDTAVYWSWFSIFYDGDLNPGNQYFPVLGSWARVYLSHPTDTGYFPIVFPLGPALSWLPGLILGEVAAAGVDAMTHGAIPAIHDGFDWIARSGGLLMSAVWILAGIALLRSWLRQWFSPRITEHALLAIIFGTPLVFYGCFNPGFSHALEFFVLSWFCAVFARKKPLQLTPVQTVLAGMAAVAILYTRLQDAGWSVVPWLMIITDMHHRGIRRCMPYCRATAQFGIGALIAFIPQFYLWFTVHHSILPPYPASYFLYIPIHAFRVLFSLKRGVFTWSPVLLIALPGLFLAPRSLRRRLGAAAIGVLYVTFMSASVSDWWGGGCFGARRFVGSLPLFAAALAAMFHHVSHRVRPATRTSARIIMGLTCLAVIWNLVLMIIYIE